MKQVPSYIILLTIIILAVSSCKIYYPPIVYHKALQEEPYDAMIVPGFPFDESKKNIFMKTRVLWAKHLYDNGLCENIIFSGSAVYSPYYESKIMAAYAIELGVPKENVFIEAKAEHTTENLVFSNNLALENGFKKIGFATDVYQTTFIATYLKKLNLEHIDLLPMRYSQIKPSKNIEVADIDYKEAFESEFVSIMERQTLNERMAGTNGDYIVTESK